MAKKNQEYSTRRVGPKFSTVRQRQRIEPFEPRIWIDGDKMYATCERIRLIPGRSIPLKIKMTFENRLWRALKEDWNILAQTLTLTYLHGCVQINFGDDEEFIMAKISHGI